jgi:hypothetical protein
LEFPDKWDADLKGKRDEVMQDESENEFQPEVDRMRGSIIELTMANTSSTVVAFLKDVGGMS